MKKVVFAVVMILTLSMATMAFADTNFGKKGTWAVGGAADINYEMESEAFNIMLAPSVSYFLIENLTLGLVPSFSRTSGSEGEVDWSHSSWGVAALVRYHYAMKGTLFLTGGAYVGFYGVGSSSEMGGQESDASASGLGFGAHVGPTLAFGGKYGGYVGAYLRYDHRDFEDEGLSVKYKPVGVMTELGLFF
jgi:hypothetical protein